MRIRRIDVKMPVDSLSTALVMSCANAIAGSPMRRAATTIAAPSHPILMIRLRFVTPNRSARHRQKAGWNSTFLENWVIRQTQETGSDGGRPRRPDTNPGIRIGGAGLPPVAPAETQEAE